MQTFEIILSVISGLSLICALGALIFSKRAAKQSSSEDFAVLNSKISDLTKSTSDEFQRNRIETHQSLENMSAKLEAMTKLSYENREKMNETIAQSLNMIRDKSIEQNERQSKIIETSIQKMQESNEKKLDQMRMTVDEKLTSTLTTRLDASTDRFKVPDGGLYTPLRRSRQRRCRRIDRRQKGTRRQDTRRS